MVDKLPRVNLDFPLEVMTEKSLPKPPSYEAYDAVSFEEVQN